MNVAPAPGSPEAVAALRTTLGLDRVDPDRPLDSHPELPFKKGDSIRRKNDQSRYVRTGRVAYVTTPRVSGGVTYGGMTAVYWPGDPMLDPIAFNRIDSYERVSD